MTLAAPNLNFSQRRPGRPDRRPCGDPPAGRMRRPARRAVRDRSRWTAPDARRL